MPVLNDPDSTMAVTFSLIPLFTPMIMMLRIAVKMPPAWQIALAYLLTILADVAHGVDLRPRSTASAS